MRCLSRRNQIRNAGPQRQLLGRATLIANPFVRNGVRNLICTGVYPQHRLKMSGQEASQLTITTPHIDGQLFSCDQVSKVSRQLRRILGTETCIGSPSLIKPIAFNTGFIRHRL